MKYKYGKYKKQLGRNTKFQSSREMVDKRRIVLGRRYPPPLSREAEEERGRTRRGSRLSATCATTCASPAKSFQRGTPLLSCASRLSTTCAKPPCSGKSLPL